MRKLTACIIIILIILMPVARAENALNAADISSMMDEHGAIMLIIDANTSDIIYANTSASEFYGYSKQQFESMKITQINTMSEEEITQEMKAAALGSRHYFIFKHRLADGEIKTVEVYSYPVKYEDKEVLFSIIFDITEKTVLQEKQNKNNAIIFISGIIIILGLILTLIILSRNRRKILNAKQEIENNNKLIDTFINASTNMVYLKDENSKYMFGNKTFQKFYNKTAEEIIGMDDFAISDEEFAQKRIKTDREVIEKNSLITDEIERNGKIYSTVKFPVKLLNNKTGVGAYIRDITKEREQENFQIKISQRLKILSDVLSMSFNNKQEQLDYVLHRALELTESKYGYIYYYDENIREFTINSWTKGVMDECGVTNPQTKYELDKTGIWGEVVRQKKPIVVNNFNEFNPLKKGYPKGHVPLNRFMSIPVIIDEKIVAVIGLANKQSQYDDNDVINMTLLMVSTWQDVQRREAEKQLSYERNKYLQTLISIGDGIMVVDKNGKVEMLNDIAENLTGWKNQEAYGIHYKNVFVLMGENNSVIIEDPVEKALKTDTMQKLEDRAVLISKNGSRYYLEDSAAPILNSQGQSEGVVLVFRDVSEKKSQLNKIQYLSFHDELTGLYNRRFFEEEIARMDTSRNLPICIIMADVNGLKITNDVFGHFYGDMLIKTTADVLKENFRSDDIIARWGGDEFVILLPKTDIEEAENIVLRIKNDFAGRRIKAIKVSVSMGISCKRYSKENIYDILLRAEENMYSEKTLNRDSIRDEEIKAMMDMLHKSNENEKIHSLQVSVLSQKIGKILNLNNDDIRKLKDAGYYHDIGKIVLDAKLLDKSLKLTAEDKNNIMKHAYVGYRILNSSNKTLDIAQYVLAHHERWDGRGYPNGLKEEQIPLLSRIIAVAECYDRLRKDYKNTSKTRKINALEVLRNNAGTKFDPKIVDVFIKMLENEDEI